jgi:transcriptional regulator of NAD metabolism
MPDVDDLKREDAEAELTKILRHGYGSLTIKIHGHRITALDSTTRQTRSNRSDED